MTEKTAVPEYCRGGKKIRAYQCGICDRLDVDDVSDKRFCRAGYWPGCGDPDVSDKRFCRAGYWPGCGDPDGCREAFKPITGRGRIGVHR